MRPKRYSILASERLYFTQCTSDLFLSKVQEHLLPQQQWNTNTKMGGDNSVCQHLRWQWFFFFSFRFVLFSNARKTGWCCYFLALIWNRPQSQNFKAKPKILRSKVAPPFSRDKYQPISWQSNCWNVIIPQKQRDNCRHLPYQRLSSGSFSSRPTLLGRVRCHPTSTAQRLRDPPSRVPTRVWIGLEASQLCWISQQPAEGLWRTYLSRRHAAP